MNSDKMEIRIGNAILWSIIILTLSIITILVSTRDLSIGSDTANYARVFHIIEKGGDHERFEIAFSSIAKSISLINGNLSLYFAVLFAILNLSIYKASRMVLGGLRSNFDILLIIGFFLASSWYQTSALNTIRQGISVPILYISILYLTEKKIFKSIIFLIISINFHISSILIVPFLFLFFVKDNLVFICFIFAGLLYALGITEYLLQNLSNIMGTTFYQNIIDYKSETERWVGFQIGFFIYTMFWGVSPRYYVRFINPEYVERFIFTWKMYCILMMPYFFFAHGAYSNRFAFIGWIFIPILLTSVVSFSNFNIFNRAFISFIVFSCGVFLFLFELQAL